MTGPPGAADDKAKIGPQLGVRIGQGWAKSHTFATGQFPVKRCNRQLMAMILSGKAAIAKAVNAREYVLDPHSVIAALKERDNRHAQATA